MIIFLFGLSMALIIASKIIQIKIDSVKKEYKIQDGEITYADLNIPAKPFFSKKYRLSGKPDYIVKKDKRYLPVELKTCNYDNPQKNHIFQLAAYCQLVEENFGTFVPYGILVYNDTYQFKIPFDPRIRFELENTINEMRHAIKTGRVNANPKEYFKCKNCSMRGYCNVRLV